MHQHVAAGRWPLTRCRLCVCVCRVLYVWAIRHPGTGYVQGINDLVTPFFLVFLTEVCSRYPQG